MITPTVGRVVWYHPLVGSLLDPGPDPEGQPLAAIITHVWSDTRINLVVFDRDGATYGRTSVFLMQEGDAQPVQSYCEWMPYQKGQAAKTEALEARMGPSPIGL